MSDSRRPNVLTIPAGAPFLRTLADGLLDGEVVPGFAPRHDPLALSAATIFLPTRRAARALRDAFLDALDGRAALLPRIAPLGDVDEDASDTLDIADVELPPAVGPLERRLTLARLVTAFARTLDRSALKLSAGDGPLIPATAAEAIHLAAELEGLIDEVETEEVDIAALDAHGPGEHDAYWAITQSFLQIALRAWPAHLDGTGRLDPSRRRRLKIDTATRQVALGVGPVIAAGSTGSVPATRRLIAAIARAPHGAVALPGLDRDGLDDAAWTSVLEGEDPALAGHPQRGLAQLLRALGVARSEVRELRAAPSPLAARARLSADALRPADSTEMWSRTQRRSAELDAALGGVTLVTAPHLRSEAAAIAVALREALETPGRTAALVTPDRDLAARVAIELERWDVAVDDSAGVSLKATRMGALLRLITEAAADLSPGPLAALLRHPACRLTEATGLSLHALDALDILALRAQLEGRGLDALRHALPETTDDERVHGAARRFGGGAREEARRLIDALDAALGPLTACFAHAAAPLASLVQGLAMAYVAVAGTPDGDDAEAVSLFLEELADASAAADPIAPRSFPGVLTALMDGRVVRPPRARHPRLQILGPLEARLIHVDLMALGGLNDGVWPPTPQSDAWINRPLRAQIGLPPPERRIGLSAHDFSQGLGAPELLLTRSAKTGGAPTIPSRWLQRLTAVADGPAFAAAQARGRALLELGGRRDEAGRDPPARAPEPRPQLELRPTRLSVTGVETWLRDPYSLYARHILRLDELGPIGPKPGPRELGEVIHAALERFARSGLAPGDPGARDALLGFGRTAFGALMARDEVQALWWPRFVRVADWFLAFEQARTPHITKTHVEQTGALTFATSAGRSFELTARADRIDALKDGAAVLIDYKTGATASAKQALAGFAPQLPLEAAIVREGGFADAGPAGRAIGGLALVRLTGRDPAGKVVDIVDKQETLDAVADKALARFKGVVDAFENPDEPYRSLSHPKFIARPEGPYSHLARVKEWSSTGGAGEDGGET